MATRVANWMSRSDQLHALANSAASEVVRLLQEDDSGALSEFQEMVLRTRINTTRSADESRLLNLRRYATGILLGVFGSQQK
ncbi:MAG: hypothetical protein K1X83_05305 [Oligoflexia bacterium]|nr:hypothetical protein [Oligoflexia bacterium]